jgi:hypothetical protein
VVIEHFELDVAARRSSGECLGTLRIAQRSGRGRCAAPIHGGLVQPAPSRTNAIQTCGNLCSKGAFRMSAAGFRHSEQPMMSPQFGAFDLLRLAAAGLETGFRSASTWSSSPTTTDPMRPVKSGLNRNIDDAPRRHS